MNIRLIGYYVLILILLFMLALMFYYYLLLRRKISINKRLLKYSIYHEDNSPKLFDNIGSLITKFIQKISKLLYKSKFLTKYSLKYQKYINKENKDYIDKMDYVSLKLIISIIFLLIILVFEIIKNQNVSYLQMIMSFLIGFYTVDIFLISKNKLLKRERENDLLKAITIMNNSFKSGRSIMQSIELVSKELDSPLGLEFKKMYVDLTYGLSLDVVFQRFEDRVKLNDVKYITTSLTILNNTGGNIVKVFESVEKTFFNNKKLSDELNNLTASSKFLYYVLLFIPIIFIILIYILDSTYFNPLFESTLGILIMITCLVLYITYIIVVKKVMKLGDYNE